MKKIFFLILLVSFNVFAERIRSEIVYQESEHLYQGYEAGVDYLHDDDKSLFGQVRAGVSALSGKYVSGVSQENKTFNFGVTTKFENSYSDFEAEVSENDNRKPFSKLRLEHFIPIKGKELGFGFTHAAFSGTNSKVAMVVLTHYLSDNEFIAGSVFTDIEQSGLTSYRMMLRKFLNERLDTRLYLSSGKAQQDIGVIQQYTSASGALIFKFSESGRVGVTATKSWGEVITDTAVGISYLCFF